VVDADAARRGELLRERGPAAGAVEAEAQQRLLAGVGLGDWREHARRDVRRAVAELAAVEHADAEAAGAGAPGDRETDEATADDCYVERSEVVRDRFASSLRRHDPDQLLTVGGRGAALSALRAGSRSSLRW